MSEFAKKYSVCESVDGVVTALVDARTSPDDFPKHGGVPLQARFSIECNDAQDAECVYEEWKRRRWFCEPCGHSHLPMPCCGEKECGDVYSCKRCGARCCDDCCVGGLCADCDVDAMVGEDEEEDDAAYD